MTPELYATGLALKLAAQQPNPRAALVKWGFGSLVDSNPRGALDAAISRRVARDQDPLADSELLDRILDFLSERLDPEDMNELTEMIAAEPPPREEEEEPAQDHPPPFPGRPRPGGAQDSARPWHWRSFDARFPSRTQGEPPPDPRADHKRRVKLDRSRGIGMDSAPAGIKPFNERSMLPSLTAAQPEKTQHRFELDHIAEAEASSRQSRASAIRSNLVGYPAWLSAG